MAASMPQPSACLSVCLGAVVLLATGCVTETSPVGRPDRRVEVLEGPGVYEVDAETARRIRLESRYLDAMQMYAEGEKQRAIWRLRDIRRDADLYGVRLSPEAERNLRRVEDGQAPIINP